MIGLGIRLALGTGREALVRLAVIASAVALGVGMLLSTFAAMNATTSQNARNAWLNTGRDAHGPDGAPAGGATGDPTFWKLSADYYQGRLMGRIDVAPTGPHPPVPPGLGRLPGPGEYFASPALAELIQTLPAAELADRYPGRLVGTIGDAALPGPDSLIVVIGHRPEELAAVPDVARVTSIVDVAPDRCSADTCRIGLKNDGMILILSVVALALVLPVVILIGTATRLAATRREQRFAAMRLVGATPRQVSMISAVEATVASVLGTLAGFGVFYAWRPLMAKLNLTQTPFFVGDLSLTTTNVLLVVVGVPIASAVSARIALRRVQISPLGVTRRQKPEPPRAWRLIPVAAGLLELAYFIGRRPSTTEKQSQAFSVGGFLIIFGIVLAGPWLTMAGARLMALRATSPAMLIAGRRLSDDPRAGYRAIGGLVLALCVMSGTVGIITAVIDERGVPAASASIAPTVIADFRTFDDRDKLTDVVSQPSDALLDELRAVPGVTGLAVVHFDRDYNRAGDVPWGGGLVSCAELATMPAFGVCPPGAATAAVADDFQMAGTSHAYLTAPWPTNWPAAGATVSGLKGLPVLEIIATTDGSKAAVERARTVLANAYPLRRYPSTVSEDNVAQQTELRGYIQLADVVIMVTFPIAGCSLAVAVAGGLSDRKRPFSLMRLSGVQLGVLRRVVLLESIAPLLAVSAVAIGTGLLGAHLFLEAQLRYSLHALEGSYYAMVGGGMLSAMAIIASVLPLLRRISGPEVARND